MTSRSSTTLPAVRVAIDVAKLSHELYIASRVRATASDDTNDNRQPACPRRYASGRW